MQYLARVSHEGRQWLAEFPDCAGCQTFASRESQLRADARDALEGWLEAELAAGDVPPLPRFRGRRGDRVLAIRIDPVLAVRIQLRAARERAGLSQSQLAERLGVTRQQVSLLENPDGDYKVSTLRRVAEALGLELAIELAEPRSA